MLYQQGKGENPNIQEICNPGIATKKEVRTQQNMKYLRITGNHMQRQFT